MLARAFFEHAWTDERVDDVYELDPFRRGSELHEEMENIMRKLIVVAATTVLAVALPGTAMAGYGKHINDGCGASYGQLVSAARAAGHATGSVSGAQNFVESGLAAAHGCTS